MNESSKFILSSSARLGFALLIASLLWPALAPRPVAAASTSCDFSQMTTADIRVVEGRTRRQFTTAVSDDMQMALANLKGYGLWVDGADGAYGDFTTPPDIQTVAWITLKSDEGKARWLWFAESPSKPGHAYAWVFTSLQSTTDNNGEHYGAHQMCATVDVPLEQVQALFQEPQSTTGVAMAANASQNG